MWKINTLKISAILSLTVAFASNDSNLYVTAYDDLDNAKSTIVNTLADNKISSIDLENTDVWVDDLSSKRIQISTQVKDKSLCINTMYYKINGGDVHMLQSKVANGDYQEMYGIIPDRYFAELGQYDVEFWVENESNGKSDVILKQVTVEETGFTDSDITIPEGFRISYELSNVYLDENNESKAVAVGSFTDFSVIAKDGYFLPKQITVQMGIRILDKTEYTYNITTGQVVVDNIVDDTTIFISATETN